MAKWIRDLWGRLTQKKALNPEMRTMLMSLDGVYDPEAPSVAADGNQREQDASGESDRQHRAPE
jgi:hypothetical protein